MTILRKVLRKYADSLPDTFKFHKSFGFNRPTYRRPLPHPGLFLVSRKVRGEAIDAVASFEFILNSAAYPYTKAMMGRIWPLSGGHAVCEQDAIWLSRARRIFWNLTDATTDHLPYISFLLDVMGKGGRLRRLTVCWDDLRPNGRGWQEASAVTPINTLIEDFIRRSPGVRLITVKSPWEGCGNDGDDLARRQLLVESFCHLCEGIHSLQTTATFRVELSQNGYPFRDADMPPCGQNICAPYIKVEVDLHWPEHKLRNAIEDTLHKRYEKRPASDNPSKMDSFTFPLEIELYFHWQVSEDAPPPRVPFQAVDRVQFTAGICPDNSEQGLRGVIKQAEEDHSGGSPAIRYFLSG